MITLRRVVLALALLLVIVPGHGKGWFARDCGSALSGCETPGVAIVPTHISAGLGLPSGAEPVAPDPPATTPSTEPPSALPAAPDPEPPPASTQPTNPPPPPPSPGSVPAPPPAVPPTVVAQVQPAGVSVYRNPGDGHAAEILSGHTEFGTPRVMPTIEARGDWIQVELPTRPNGSTGWIRTASVTLVTIRDRIEIDRGSQALTWLRDGQAVGTVNAAVGAPISPTPAGTFFVTDVLPATAVETSTGQYGVWVIALNGFSETYTTLGGRDARLAIHGTDQPASLGQAVSDGCVRIGAGPLDTLAHNVALGTPVVIR